MKTRWTGRLPLKSPTCTRPASSRGLTLHPCGAEALASEEDGVVVVLGVIQVALLLHEGPAADVLQTPGRVPPFDEADGLADRRQKQPSGPDLVF